MNPKNIQLCFFLGICAITLHFTILFGKEAIHYLRLNQRAPVRITQWEIIPIKKRFAIKADYTFKIEEKTWENSFTLNPPYHLNEWAALSDLKMKAKEPWSAHYNPQNPQLSVLEKSFPYGLLARAGICYCVLIYFFTLRRKVIS